MKSGMPGTFSPRNKKTLVVVAATVTLAIGLAGCGTTSGVRHAAGKPQVDPKLGVAPSPRVVADGQPVPKGGGRAMLGQPYKVAGKTYVPRVDPSYKTVGLASWYGTAFHGRRTANGEVFDRGSISAAHPTMPLPSYARLTSLSSGRSVIVRVNDRGPYHSNRVLDMSQRAAEMLGVKQAGVAKIQVEYVGPAPVEGDDTPYLLASYRGPALDQPTTTDRPNIMLAAVESIPGVKSVFGVFGGSDQPAAPVRAARTPAPAQPAPVVVASADNMVGTPAPAFNVLPPTRPVETFQYVTIASADPADYVLGSPMTVAAVGQPMQLPPLGYSSTPAISAKVQPVVMFGNTVLPPLPPQVSSYAAERVANAYAAVDNVDAGVGLSSLVDRLQALSGASEPAPKLTGAVVQLGVFSNPDNVQRLTAVLAPYGKLTVSDLSVDGKPMKLLRLSALKSTPDAAIEAASRAGVAGAHLVR